MDLSVVTVGINPDKWNKVFAGLAVGVRYYCVVVRRKMVVAIAELLFLLKVCLNKFSLSFSFFFLSFSDSKSIEMDRVM